MFTRTTFVQYLYYNNSVCRLFVIRLYFGEIIGRKELLHRLLYQLGQSLCRQLVKMASVYRHRQSAPGTDG